MLAVSLTEPIEDKKLEKSQALPDRVTNDRTHKLRLHTENYFPKAQQITSSKAFADNQSIRSTAGKDLHESTPSSSPCSGSLISSVELLDQLIHCA